MDHAILALARQLNRENGVTCRAIEFTPQGDLWLEIERKGILRRLGWIASDGSAPDDAQASLFEMPLRFENAPGRRQQSDLIRPLKAALDRIWSKGGAAWLDRRNREISLVSRSTESLLALFPWIASGRAFWADWRVSEIRTIQRADGMRFEFTLEDGRSTSFQLALDPGGRRCAREHTLASTPLGLVLATDSGSIAGTLPERLDRPMRAFAFLVSRGCHGQMVWADRPSVPAVPDPSENRAGGNDLLEYCMRSWNQWGGKGSAFFGTWGDADFLSIGAVLRGDRRLLFHGSRECSNCSTLLTNRFQTGPLPWEPNQVRHDFGSFGVTDLDDSSTVFGGEKRLEQALASIRSSRGADQEILVHMNCEYEMMGDDAAGACANSSALGCRASCLEQRVPGFHSDGDESWWRNYVLEPALSGTAPGRGVMLLGFGHPWERQIREIESLLSQADIQIHSALLPSADTPGSRAAVRPALAVMRPWAPVAQAVGEPIRDAGLPLLEFEAPYGFQGTLRWIRRLGSALGREDVEERLRRIALPYRDAWAALQRRANGLIAGFVADVGTIRQISSPSFFFGFDPLDFLEDAGLGIRLFQLGGTDVCVRTKDGQGWTDIVIRRPHVRPDLDSLLRKHPCDMLYCDLPYGDTANACGIPSFGIRHFEMGLPGAIRTLQRLLSIAGMKLRPPQTPDTEAPAWI